MSDALSRFKLDDDEIREFLAERPRRRDASAKEVCVCGHGIGRHVAAGERWVCRPGRQMCRCTNPRSVLKVSDNRFFASKTEGEGSRHALIRGMVLASKSERNVTMEWLLEPSCARPECMRSDAEADLQPVPINRAGRISNRDEAINVFACRDCRMKFGTDA